MTEIYVRDPADLRLVRIHAIYAAMNARPLAWPFQHVIAYDLLPAWLVREIGTFWPKPDEMTTLSALGRVKAGIYENRKVAVAADQPAGTFWRRFADEIFNDEFASAILGRFRDTITARGQRGDFGDIGLGVTMTHETLIVEDGAGYKIGPHTDAPHKALSMIYYPLEAPSAVSYGRDWGTGVYVPNERGFTCRGGPHYEFEQFALAHRVPYHHNSALFFPKTDRSFHGVEPLKQGGRRVVIHDIRLFAAEAKP